MRRHAEVLRRHIFIRGGDPLGEPLVRVWEYPINNEGKRRMRSPSEP